jgi:hypothetical protein
LKEAVLQVELDKTHFRFDDHEFPIYIYSRRFGSDVEFM